MNKEFLKWIISRKDGYFALKRAENKEGISKSCFGVGSFAVNYIFTR